VYYEGFIEDRAATMLATLDGSSSEFDPSIGSNPDGSTVTAVIWSQTGLSSTATHKLTVSWLGPGSEGGSYGVISGIMYVTLFLIIS